MLDKMLYYWNTKLKILCFSSIFIVKFRCDLYFHNLEHFLLEHFIKDKLFISEKCYITYVLSLDSVAYLYAVT